MIGPQLSQCPVKRWFGVNFDLILHNTSFNFWISDGYTTNSPFPDLSQEKVWNAIDLQPKIMQAIIASSSPITGETGLYHKGKGCIILLKKVTL